MVTIFDAKKKMAEIEQAEFKDTNGHIHKVVI